MCEFICIESLCCAVYCYRRVKLAISETALVSKKKKKKMIKKKKEKEKKEWCPLTD